MISDHMDPSYSSSDSRYLNSAERVVGRDGFARLGQCSPSNLSHVRLRNLRDNMRLPARHSVRVQANAVAITASRPFLLDHLSHVAIVRIRSQVVGSNAGGVVALVANKRRFGRDFASIRPHPRESVRSDADVVIQREAAVTRRLSLRGPDPTVSRLPVGWKRRPTARRRPEEIDLAPESFFDTLTFSHAEPPSKVRWSGSADALVTHRRPARIIADWDAAAASRRCVF